MKFILLFIATLIFSYNTAAIATKYNCKCEDQHNYNHIWFSAASKKECTALGGGKDPMSFIPFQIQFNASSADFCKQLGGKVVVENARQPGGVAA